MQIISRGCAEKDPCRIRADLTKAVHIAQAAETVRDETHALRGNTTRQPPAKQVKTAFSIRDTAGGAYKARQLDSRECYRCGGRGHHPSTCKFKSQKCHFCKGQGHISRVCRKQSQQDELKKGTTAVRTTAKVKPRPTHQIDEDTVSVVFAQSGKGGVKITLEVASSQIPMEVDTEPQ